MRCIFVFALLSACASSSAPPLIVEHEDTSLVVLPADTFPDDPGSTSAHLVVRDDHALVLGRGACLGKAIDRCLAGAPLYVRGEAPPTPLTELRRPTSLLWGELTQAGDAIVHRLPEAGEPSLLRIAEDSERIDADVGSGPSLARAVDGSVLVQAEAGEGRDLLRIDDEGVETLLHSGWFTIEAHAGATHVVGASPSAHDVLVIAPSGEVTRWVEGASSMRVALSDDRRVYCGEHASGGELVEPASGTRFAIERCGEVRGARGLIWNESQAWIWSDAPVQLDVAGQPLVHALSEGWVVLDDEGVRWIDAAGRELRREPTSTRGLLHARGDHVAVSWSDELGSTIRRFDTLGVDDTRLERFAYSLSMADSGVLWVVLSDGPRSPPNEVVRIDAFGATSVLTGASRVVLYDTLLVADDALFSLRADMEHVLDMPGMLRHVRGELFEYDEGSERVMARWDGNALTELARTHDSFHRGPGDAIRWQTAEGWTLGHYHDEGIDVAFETTDGSWLSTDLALVGEELCSMRANTCWEIPEGWRVVDAQVSETDRMFSILYDDEEGDLALWYSR